MATLAPGGPATRRRIATTAPDLYEKMLAIGAVVLLVAVLVAVYKGHADWPRVPVVVWPHLLTIIVALALTPVLLLRPRGDRRHRLLGTIWVIAMILTAALSFLIRRHGFSPIHILSAVTLLTVPRAWWTARRHQVASHRSSVRAIVTGALLIAGFFTFPFDRLLGHWLFN